MTAFTVTVFSIMSVVFACIFGGAVLGMILRARLPKHHLGDDSKDVVRLGMGLVATMAALVLGLLVASAKSSYDSQKSGLDDISTSILLLDNTLAEYGPEAQDARDLLRRTIVVALAQTWHEDASQSATLDAPAVTGASRGLSGKIQELTPQNDGQRRLQSQALQIVVQVGQARWLMVAQQESATVPPLFLVIMTFWLTVLFASFGLFAPPNPIVVGTLLLSALSVSGAVFLILELAHPLTGLLQISSAPLRNALAHLGQ